MQVLARPSMTSRASRPLSETGSGGDFSLGDEGADVVFRGVGVERDFRPLVHAQQLVLVAMKAFEQAVERGVAGSGALEDAVEAGAQDLGLFGARRELVVFQAPIEPPED